jgi:hypothetical protein
LAPAAFYVFGFASGIAIQFLFRTSTKKSGKGAIADNLLPEDNRTKGSNLTPQMNAAQSDQAQV